jgi:threonine dehydrogenase-like Zn-dependent dehydrogenase
MSFVITHRMSLDDAPLGFDTFLNNEDDRLEVISNP